MYYQVDEVANYLIWRANSDAELGENISNLKLQKLLYYVQGFHLAIVEEPLFDEPILRWRHGPVVERMYRKYRQWGAQAIPTDEDFDPSVIDSETQELIEDVYSVYGQYSAWGLRNLTHNEPPWIETPDQEVISHDLMRAFFETQVRSTPDE